MGAITAEVVETGEKRDQRGRRVTPPERRAEMVRAYAASGATMRAFARREGINYTTLANWVTKAQGPNPAKPLVRFAEVQLPVPATRGTMAKEPLEVRLADGTVVRGTNPVEVAALVRALQA